MGPLIAVGVREIQTVLHLLEADAMTTVVLIRLGMIGILNVTDYLRALHGDPDMDETGLRRGDAMFEGILDKTDADERDDPDRGGWRLIFESDIHIPAETDLHQVDVVLQELGLVLQINLHVLVVIEDMAQEF